MKKQMAIVGAAAAALMMAGTAHAENGGGYVGLSYSNNNDTSVNSWTVDGAFAAGDNIQIDAGYSRLDGGGNSANAYSVGGHLFTRNNQWLWGGYVGYDSISDSGDAHEWTVAGQTQYYMDHATLSGNLSYSSVNLLGSDVHTTQIDGEARIFATDNFSIQEVFAIVILQTGVIQDLFVRLSGMQRVGRQALQYPHHPVANGSDPDVENLADSHLPAVG
jgi:hypothetical protein